MKPVLNLVHLNAVPIFEQLQWEEALLRTNQENWCLINQGSPPAIVMGISGHSQDLIWQEKLKQVPIPVIRRFTGGGTVIVDESTLFVTLICQADTLSIPPFPRPLMQWTAEAIYQPLFSDLPFQLQENDYVLKERKWGGNAQSIIKGRWLHHSSLLWDFCSENMEYLHLPPKTPAYRQNRSHNDFLCRLCDYFPCPTLFQDQIIQQLGTHFTLISKRKEEILPFTERPHRKATTLLFTSLSR